MRRRLTVTDTFLVPGRGLVIAPGPPIAEVEPREPGPIAVELRFAEGARRPATLTLAHVFLKPPPPVPRWGCLLRTLGKADVPIGTEIRCSERNLLPRAGPGAG